MNIKTFLLGSIFLGVFLCGAEGDNSQSLVNEALKKAIDSAKKMSQERNPTEKLESIKDIELDKEEIKTTQNNAMKQKSSTKARPKDEKLISNHQTQEHFTDIAPKGSTTMDLTTSMTIRIIKDKYSILDFPFVITDVNFDEFQERAQAQSSEQNAEQSPINIEQKQNRLIINSKILGKTQMIVWGGEYPVIIDLLVNQKDGKNYYKFTAKIKKESLESIRKLENNEHERVINILATAMYKNKIPRGYEKSSKKEFFILKKEKLRVIKEYSLIGKYYIAEKYDIINTSEKNSLHLYETMFYDESIYAVSLLSNILEPLKSTAMYIVRKNNTIE